MIARRVLGFARLKRWLALLNRYWSPPAFEDEEKNRAAGLTHLIARLMLVLMVLLFLAVVVLMPGDIVVTLASVLLFLVGAIVMLYLVNRGHLAAAGWLLVGIFYLTVTRAVFSDNGVRDLRIGGYFVVVTLAMLLLGRRAGVIVSLASGATIVAAYVAEANGIILPELSTTTLLFELVVLLVLFGFTAVLMLFAVQSNEYAFGQQRRTAAALREANRELGSSRDVLVDHAAVLERRFAYLQASSEVAHAVVSMLDVEQLLGRVVELIRERFDLYYVGIFLLDDAVPSTPRPEYSGAAAGGEWVNLRAGTGPEGRAMLARGHRLRVGEGMIGWSVAQGEPRVAQEAHVDQVRVTTAELPETRSEAALPLKSRGRVLGAITVQAARAAAFDQEAVAVLQVLADQVAVALDNARLLRESQMALEAERRAYGEISAHAWADMVRHGRELGYVCRQDGTLSPALATWPADMVHASERGEMVVSDGDPADRQSGDGSRSKTVAVPIKIRDRVMGAVRLQKTEDGQAWTAEELALMHMLTSQIELALESARLYEDSHRRAVQERLVGEVTARMRETLDMDAVLRTAAQEIRQALGLSQLTVRLAGEPDHPQSEGMSQ